MEFCFFFKSMYPGTWNFVFSSNPCTMNLRKQNLGTFWKMWWWKVVGGRGREETFFWNLTIFFYIQFKDTFYLILPAFKVSSKSFFSKNFKKGLTFWHMWFFNFQNLVRSCQHIDGTPCIIVYALPTISRLAKSFWNLFQFQLWFDFFEAINLH